MMNWLRRYLPFVLLALLITVFIFVAAQKLGSAPQPDTDESMTLQVPYEMLFRGKLAFPMYRYLGGNIENVWHSYTPVFFVLLSSFQKVFGWGLLQGRAFNLVIAALILVIIYLIGRELSGWRLGLISALVLVADPTFLDRSRIVRNDYIAALFGLMAFWLYELAERKNLRWLYVACGVSAGAGVMCHTNLLYALVMIGVLMLLKDGWRVVRTAKPYLFGAGAFAAMSYEIIYDLIDYNNFLAQNRADPAHFRVLDRWGWWTNLQQEPVRYSDWYNGLYLKIAAPLDLLHCFLYLALIAGIYLAIRIAVQAKESDVTRDPRTRVLVATALVMLFFTFITQRKIIQYVIHLAPWFSLCIGILIDDALSLIGRMHRRPNQTLRAISFGAGVGLIAVALAFGYALFHQQRVYLERVNDPERATFDELKTALREIVPDDICPIAIKSGVLWLAFPEHDQCFVALEGRMRESVDIVGNEYALIIRPKHRKRENRLMELTEGAHLLGEIKRTPSGNFEIYYTGTNPEYLSLAPKRYLFNKNKRGYVLEE